MESTLGAPGWDGAYAAFPDSSCSLLCCETHTQNTERQVDATNITFALSFWVSSLEEWIELTCTCRWHSSVFQQGRVVTFPADLPGVVGQDTLGGEMISFKSLQWYYSKATFHIFDECALPGDGWIQRESKGFPLWGNTWVNCWSIPWYTEHRTSLPWSNAALCQGMLLLPAATASTHTSTYSSFTFQQEGGEKGKGKKEEHPTTITNGRGLWSHLCERGKGQWGCQITCIYPMPPVKTGSDDEVLVCLWAMRTWKAPASLRERGRCNRIIWDSLNFHLQVWKFLPLAITMPVIF